MTDSQTKRLERLKEATGRADLHVPARWQRLAMATLQVHDRLVNTRVYRDGDAALAGQDAREAMGLSSD